MHAVKEGNFERFQRVFEESKEKNPQNKNGWSVLHEAAKRGCHDMVHVMLNNIVISYKLPASWVFPRCATTYNCFGLSNIPAEYPAPDTCPK